MDEAAPAERQRLDKWIWFARFQKARETCADLIRKGHVRIDGRRVKDPGTMIRRGVVLTLALPGQTLVVEVLDFAERRGGPADAAGLFRVIEPD